MSRAPLYEDVLHWQRYGLALGLLLSISACTSGGELTGEPKSVHAEAGADELLGESSGKLQPALPEPGTEESSGGLTEKLQPVQPEAGIDGSLDDFAEQARRRYLGSSNLAELNASSAARFFDIALWGPFRRDPLLVELSIHARSSLHWQVLDVATEPSSAPEVNLILPSDGGRMESSATSQLEAPSLERVRFLVERVHCDDGSRTTLTLDYVDGQIVESWHGYDRVIVEHPHAEEPRLIRVSGMVHKSAADRSPAFGLSTATLLVEDLDSGEQVLVDGFERASLHTYDFSCHLPIDWVPEWGIDILEDPRNWFSGRISHSLLGLSLSEPPNTWG